MNPNKLIKIGKKLFPINRSLTGRGNLKTLKMIKKEIPNLKIKVFKSRKKVYDWRIPDEWNVKFAYLKDKKDKKILDFKNNNLHLVGYSQPIKKQLNKTELLKHLHSTKSMPTSVPYITSYYNKYWGFCLTHKQKMSIIKNYKSSDKFQVNIKSNFKKKGKMHYGELVLDGKTKSEILISTYICHPSMANNELSGPLVSIALINFFKKIKLEKSIRFIFIPETIGSIAYINKNLRNLKKRVFGGYVLTCIGDNRSYSYINTKYKNSISDLAAKKAFKKLGINYKNYSFLKRGSDERQFNSPGVDLNIGSLMRTKHGEYKEYHTSSDNFNVVTARGLYGGFLIAKESILNLLKYNNKEHLPEERKIKKNNPLYKFICEPNLGKRGLYNLLGVKTKNLKSQKILDFLQYCDGSNNLNQISKLVKVSLNETKKIYKILKNKELVKNVI